LRRWKPLAAAQPKPDPPKATEPAAKPSETQ